MNRTLTLNSSLATNFAFFINLKYILRLFLIFSVLAINAFLVFYIFQINFEVSERHLINKQEKRLNGIVIENQNLEISLIEMNSLDNIIAKVAELNFEKIDKIQYIKVVNGQMVLK